MSKNILLNLCLVLIGLLPGPALIPVLPRDGAQAATADPLTRGRIDVGLVENRGTDADLNKLHAIHVRVPEELLLRGEQNGDYRTSLQFEIDVSEPHPDLLCAWTNKGPDCSRRRRLLVTLDNDSGWFDHNPGQTDAHSMADIWARTLFEQLQLRARYDPSTRLVQAEAADRKGFDTVWKISSQDQYGTKIVQSLYIAKQQQDNTVSRYTFSCANELDPIKTSCQMYLSSEKKVGLAVIVAGLQPGDVESAPELYDTVSRFIAEIVADE